MSAAPLFVDPSSPSQPDLPPGAGASQPLRQLSPNLRRLVTACILGLFAFVAWTTYHGQLPNIRQYAVVLGLCFSLGFILMPARASDRGAVPWYDWLLAGLVLAACSNVFWHYWAIMFSTHQADWVDYGLASVLIGASVELSRRCIGKAFIVLILAFGAYALLGQHIPGMLGHGGVSTAALLDMLYFSTDGIWGMLTDIFVSLLLLFVVLGAVMMASGVSDTFMDVAKSLGGRMRGGPAKIAVISSAMMGSITGSSVTNVAMTGSITIPMMKRMGYKPEVAAGIEATASSGGQITPPLMGAGLFLMAEMLQLPVTTVMFYALAPALLFYFSVLTSVHFDAIVEGRKALAPHEVPPLRRFLPLRVWAPILLPFAWLFWLLLEGKSVYLSVLSAVGLMVFLFLAFSRSWRDMRERLQRLVQGLVDSAESVISLAALIVTAGILVGLIGYLGVGVKLSTLVLSLGQGLLLPTLVLAAVVVVILGMGVPTTAAYILAVSVMGVVFHRLGISDLPAHIFLFYFATLSAITPPVCSAVFVAANIAQAPWLKVAWHTVRFASIKYLMPFLFIFHPALLDASDPWAFAAVIAQIAIGVVYMSAATSGLLLSPLSKPVRWLLFGLALLCLFPQPAIALAGIGGCVLINLWSAVQRRRTAPPVGAGGQ